MCVCAVPRCDGGVGVYVCVCVCVCVGGGALVSVFERRLGGALCVSRNAFELQLAWSCQ